jgi:NAD(P)-dependent dehydrogenase (short-subunit alcohol dehydrogenase family)
VWIDARTGARHATLPGTPGTPGGTVETPMMSEGLTQAQRAWFVDQVPLGRMADPNELAGAVIFLASEPGRYVTGATINVSGGQLMY